MSSQCQEQTTPRADINDANYSNSR